MGLTRNQILQHVSIIRAQSDVFCVDEVLLRRRTGEIITGGESTPVYAPDITIRARVINRSGASRSNIAAQFRATRQTFYDSTYRIQLPYGTEVSTSDLIIYHDKGTDVVRTLEVSYVPPQHAMTGAFVIGAEEVE